jgi:hypothetical protein
MMMSGGDANMPGAPGNTGALMNMGMIPGPSGGMGYLNPPMAMNGQAMYGPLTPMDFKRMYAAGAQMGGMMGPMGPMGPMGTMGRTGPMGAEEEA